MKRRFKARIQELPHNKLQLLLSKLTGKDFSEVEDSPYAFSIIKELAFKAGKNAAAEAKAAGFSRIFVRDNQLIRANVNGSEEVIKDSFCKVSNFYVKPSRLLYVQK